MKARIPVYLAALTSLAVLTAGDASAFNHIGLGRMNGMVPHRTAPQPFHPIKVFKPTVSHTIKIGKPAAPHTIKIDKPEYVAAPRR